MRDGTRAFFQLQDIFHYFRAFKTEILHIYSLIWQILKQLSASVSVTSVGYLPRSSAAQEPSNVQWVAQGLKF